ncbi:MAG: Glycosyl transferase group 1 [Candidatus Moranbacteria bacterium GW2011_GWA2_39_41]|nr:MAG: Glycosyl transferase group 1 [Candidatus Moranbacteria bacterium GW2011_GWA2_39_41]
MRIGINASFARKPGSGIGQVTINFLKKIAQKKTSDEFVLYLEEDLPRDIKLPKNFSKKIFLPAWKRDDLVHKIWWEKWSLPKMVKQDNCEALISMYQCPTILNKNIKHVMVVHDLIPKLFPEYLNNWRKRLYWSLTEKAIKRADKILAISSRTEKDLIAHLGIDPQKISVNHVDVDPIYKKRVQTRHASSVLKKYRLKPGYIYTGGGLEVRKNTEGVIRAYKFLLEKNANEHFVHEFPKLVVSGKMMPELAPLIVDVQKLVKELNLSKRVRLLGFVPQTDLPALYNQSVMFVYPSHYEGFGMPVLEAMSAGTPAITSKHSSLPEVGRDGVLYCDPKDVLDIAMVMKNVLLHAQLRLALVVRGKERAQYFSWGKFSAKVFNVVKNL